MATIKLNIYEKEDKNKIEKTYTSESYDLMLGTVEEFMQIIDLDKMGDNMEVAKMLVKTYNKIKPLLQDIFPGVTAEELDRVKIKELIPVVIQIGESIAESLNILNPGNLTRA